MPSAAPPPDSRSAAVAASIVRREEKACTLGAAERTQDGTGTEEVPLLPLLPASERSKPRTAAAVQGLTRSFGRPPLPPSPSPAPCHVEDDEDDEDEVLGA